MIYSSTIVIPNAASFLAGVRSPRINAGARLEKNPFWIGEAARSGSCVCIRCRVNSTGFSHLHKPRLNLCMQRPLEDSPHPSGTNWRANCRGSAGGFLSWLSSAYIRRSVVVLLKYNVIQHVENCFWPYSGVCKAKLTFYPSYYRDVMRTGAIDLSIRNSRRIVYCGVANGEDEEWGKCPPLSITQFFLFLFLKACWFLLILVNATCRLSHGGPGLVELFYGFFYRLPLRELCFFFCVCARIIKSYQIDFEELPSTINVYTVIPVY